MSREAPISPTKSIMPGSWWIKMGLGGVTLLLIASVAGLELRREQLRSVLREAAETPVAVMPSGPRPVFFQPPTEGAWVDCIEGLPSWWEGEQETERWAEPIVDCAARTELGETSRYLGFHWSSPMAEHARTLEPLECARTSFAILRFAHDMKHFDRARAPVWGAGDTRAVRAGLEALVSCGGSDALRSEMRNGLETLESDLPSIRTMMHELRELQRRDAYQWMARTAWDYDDPFFYETSGLISRYRRQLGEWARWQRLSQRFDEVATTEQAARLLPELRREPGLHVDGIEADAEHLALLRAARMLLGGGGELDPRTGAPMRLEQERCATYADGALCIPDARTTK